jgi:hypothetical protein
MSYSGLIINQETGILAREGDEKRQDITIGRPASRVRKFYHNYSSTLFKPQAGKLYAFAETVGFQPCI